MFVHNPKYNLLIPSMSEKTDTDGRFYKDAEGNTYPSITTLLKYTEKDNKRLTEWKQRVGEKQANIISQKAKDRGSNVHAFIECFLNNNPVISNSFDMTLFVPLKETLEKNLTNIYLQEKALFSKAIKIAGRVDCIADWKGIPSIIDFKTATNPKKKEWIENYFLQTTAYKIMWEELTGHYIPQIVVIITTESGIIQVFEENPSKYVTKLLMKASEFYENL